MHVLPHDTISWQELECPNALAFDDFNRPQAQSDLYDAMHTAGRFGICVQTHFIILGILGVHAYRLVRRSELLRDQLTYLFAAFIELGRHPIATAIEPTF
jgi:hypothetical protein